MRGAGQPSLEGRLLFQHLIRSSFLGILIDRHH